MKAARATWIARTLRCAVGVSLLALLALAGSPARAQQAPDAGHAAAGSPEETIEPAIISIEVTQQRTDWYSPWQGTRPEVSQGSGFLIGPGRIMTNAHVVSDARQIVVRRNGDDRPYFADIEFIGHDTDLATLRVNDPAFSRGVPPLALGDLPSLRSRVRTYGYPAGGEKISRTEGVVSRIQFITYVHSGADQHLAVQTDSAINPGNSGGPVVQEGKVIGVAFQASTRLNDVGYFIPVPVIRRFLEDVQDGTYEGYGDLGVVTSNLINPTYRRSLGLQDDHRGVVVDRVLPRSSAAGLLREADVILAVDDVPVEADGTINYHGYSLGYQQTVEQKQIGEAVKATVWRSGKALELRVPLHRYPEAERMRAEFDTPAPYLVYAGLVFMELNRDYLRTFGNYWETADKHLLYRHFYAFMESDQPYAGTVVLARVLPHRINTAYTSLANSQVAAVNGVTVHTLRELESALAAARSGYQVFDLMPGEQVLVLDKAAADTAQPEILGRYAIPKDRYLP